MHKPQKKQTPIINNNKSTKVNKLIKTGKTVKTFKQLVKTNKLVEAGELVIKLDKLERSTKSLRSRKPWMKNHNNNLSRIRKSVKRSSGPLILAKSLKGTKKAVARLLKNKSSININRLKNSKLAQIRRIIEYRKVKRARENKKKLRYFRDFLLGPRGFEIYAKRRFKWYTEKDFSKNPTFYYIKDRDIYVPERKVRDLDKYIYRFERKLTTGWKFWARRSLMRLELKQCNWAKSLARVLISYSARKKKTPGIRRKHTIASIDKARGGKDIWERTHQRMTLINISERFRVRSRFKSIWHFLHKIPRSIMQKRKEAIVPYYHYKRINHRGGYHFLKVLHWDCRPKWDMSERIWKRRRLVLNTAAYKALRYRVPYYTKIMTAGFTIPIYPYSFLESAVKTGDKDGDDDDEDLRLTNLEFLQYPRKKAYFLQRRVKSLAQRLAIIRVRENRRSISRKFFLSAGIPRHRRQTMDQIFEKEYPRKLKIEFFTPGSHQEWASRRILSWQQRQGKKLYTRKTKNKKRRWRRVYYLQSKFDYKKRVQRRARWAAQHKPTKRVKLLMPVTSRSVRLSLFINTSRSNYFFTLVKSKKKHPKKYSTLKVFTAGNLKNITTARKRRDMTTFERLFMRVLKYLLANQIERLYQIKVKLNPKLKYSAIKKYSIKKILRLYNYKKVYIRALRLQLMRPHAHRRRAPKRRRK